MTITFNPDELACTAVELQIKYRQAAPFPRIDIDDFFSSAANTKLSADFPSPEAPLWFEFRRNAENKQLQNINFYAIPPSNGRLESKAASAHNTVLKERLDEIRKLTPNELLREAIPPVILRMTRSTRNKAGGSGK